MAAPYNPPVKGENFVFRFSLEDFANPGTFLASPTLAAGDFTIATESDVQRNLGTLPVVNPAGSILIIATLSAAEMNADGVAFAAVDQSNPKAWADLVLFIPTT